MRFVAIIFVLISVSGSLKCYSGLGVNFTWEYDCPPETKQCYREVYRRGPTLMEFTGCDRDSSSSCVGWFSSIPNGKCTCDAGGILAKETCCCGQDLCNVDEYFRRYPCTGSKLQPFLVVCLLFIGFI